METTGQTIETGKWLIPSMEKIDEYPHPTRFLGTNNRGNMNKHTVDTIEKEYAVVLQGIVSNPHEDTEDANDPNNKAPPLRPNKRHHTTLSYEDTESFPPLPTKRDQAEKSNDNGKKSNDNEKTNSSNAARAKQNNTQEQVMATAPELSEFSQKLAAMNARPQRQMETMKTDHA
eukprot:scaffold24837_cov63-Attheya_sp.AAC.1